MKKSELIKKLQEIEGDPDVEFLVDNDEILDDFNYTFMDSINEISLKPYMEYNEMIYTDKEELEDTIVNEYPVLAEENIQEIVNRVKEIENKSEKKIIIEIGV